MSATEDESQSLDAGWDDEQRSSSSSDEAEVDEAWDSLPPPVNRASGGVLAPSVPPVTEEVDSGWDDVPEGAPGPAGKRGRHRPRRAKSSVATTSLSPVLLPRPAEPSKKQQRDHARKQRAHEAQVKQQRKLERKAERASEVRVEAEARQRQAEADERARQERREAREREEKQERKERKQTARPKTQSSVAVKPSRVAAKRPAAQLAGADEPHAADERVVAPSAPKRGFRFGLWLTLAVVAVIAGFLLIFRR